MRTIRCLCLCAAAFGAAAAPASAQRPAPAVHLLDVPYLPQGEALCGGAAAAMVMRYWGATDVYADAFSGVIDPAAGGIHAEDLARELRAKGWQALTFKGDVPFARANVDRGRPVVALIEDRPGRFHFVVIVAVGRDRIIVHDPARGPFRVLDEVSFARAWGRAGFWSMVVLPPAFPTAAASAPSSTGPTSTAGPCGRMVEEGVRLAQADEEHEARRVLDSASLACPGDPGPWRERAGLHARRKEWREAAADAREALRRDSTDEHAARILATSLFLEGDTLGALAAWNAAGEPRIDLVNIQGRDRTRYAVAAHALGLEPRTLLTADALRRAERAAAAIPSALISRVSYRPAENGRAQVDAVILERPLVPRGVVGISSTALRVLTDREVSAALASPAGNGELWTASWRWWRNRPRTALSFAAPATGRFRGVWRLEAADEKQTYARAGSPVVEHRRNILLQLSDWTTGGVRWTVAAGADRWSGQGTSVSIGAGLEHRAAGDRLSTTVWASAVGGGVDTWTARASGEWRTRARNDGGVLLTRIGIEAAGAGAPLALWPGAGSGQGREILLRAHPLLDDGVVARGVFGRRIAYGGAEWRRWLSLMHAFRVAPAVFVDSARAFGVVTPFDTRLHVDTGVGLRAAIPGAGVLRLDVARGVRDGRTAWSVGWGR